jgi:tetratricopeptide (TPR) repeat protein
VSRDSISAMKRFIIASLILPSLSLAPAFGVGHEIQSPHKARTPLQSAKMEKAEAHQMLKEVEEKLKKNPDDKVSYLNQGVAHNLLEQYTSAVKSFTEAIRIDPKLAPAYAHRAHAYLGLDMLKEALADCNMAIKLDPKMSFAYHTRGNVYHDMEKWQLALADFNKCLALDPNDHAARINRTRVLYHLEQHGVVISEATRYIKLHPNDPVGYDNRGLAYTQLKQFAAAIADFNKALALSPNNPKYLCHRGIAYAESGQHLRAIQDLDLAIKLKPDFALAYFDRGLSHHYLHNYKQAASDMQTAIRLDHRFALALIQLPLDPTKGPDKSKPISQAEEFYYRATTKILLKHNETAIADLRKYLEMTSWKGPLAPSAVILGYLGLRRNKLDTQANALLDEAKTKLDNTKWPYPIIEYLRDEMTADQVIALATDNDMLTDVHGYIGIDLLWTGKRDEGLQHINWVWDNGNGNLISCAIAMRERELLQMKRSHLTELD